MKKGALAQLALALIVTLFALSACNQQQPSPSGSASQPSQAVEKAAEPTKAEQIGSWTEEMFLDISRTGRHLGGNGRGVLPPMPWFWIRNLTDDDLKAVFAYLNSIPPIRNAILDPKIPEEVIWQLRDSFDQMVLELPQEEWAAKKEKKER